jgi:hypothetical protein
MKFIIKRDSIRNYIHVDADGNEAEQGWIKGRDDEDEAFKWPNWYYHAYDKRPPIDKWFTPLEYVEKIRNLTDKRYRPDDPDNFIKEGFWLIEIDDFEQIQDLFMYNHINGSIEISLGCPKLPGYMVLTIRDGDYYD